ncbi:MAG: cyclic nucleotide-binding domain-containing protein [Planctomycetota bacterium]|nr:cyclic nucleotide-binding domain-containing protein [Planctomycetota bacterium]
MDSSGLNASDLFSAMSDEEIEKLIALCERREFSEGDVLFTEHDLGAELFIVEEGRVRISKAVSLSSDHTLGMVERGGIIGEMAVIESTHRSATATAQTDGAILSMDSEVFEKLVSETPETGLKILRGLTLTIVHRLRVTNDLLSDTVAWGVEVSGAAGLSFQSLMTESADIQLTLMNNREIAGRLVKVEKDKSERLDLMVLDTLGKIHIVPYHAIMEMTFESNLVYEDHHDDHPQAIEDEGSPAQETEAGSAQASEEETD